MIARRPRYSKEEFARRGDEIYERDVRPKTSSQDHGKYVAIDVETRQWEMDADEIAAGNRLLARVPDAQMWMTRVGFGYVSRFGAPGLHWQRNLASAEESSGSSPSHDRGFRYSKEEAARRGDEIYERKVRPQIVAEDFGKFVAIDMDSENWEMDADEMAANQHLRSRIPDAQIWMTCVGLGYARRFGAALLRRQA